MSMCVQTLSIYTKVKFATKILISEVEYVVMIISILETFESPNI